MHMVKFVYLIIQLAIDNLECEAVLKEWCEQTELLHSYSDDLNQNL